MSIWRGFSMVELKLMNIEIMMKIEQYHPLITTTVMIVSLRVTKRS